MLASCTEASSAYVLPPNVTEFTANSITIGSLEFSLRFRFVTVIVTVAPAGITPPLEPVTEFCTVAVNLSPTLLVLVPTLAVGESESVVPAAIVPTAPPPVDAALPLGRVTVLPLAVFVGVDGVDGRGAGREVLGRGVVLAGAGLEVAGGFAGTSFSCGCAAESRPASAKSRSSDESRRSALVSCFDASVLQPPSTSAAPSASGPASRPIYFTIDPPSWSESELTWSEFH